MIWLVDCYMIVYHVTTQIVFLCIAMWFLICTNHATYRHYTHITHAWAQTSQLSRFGHETHDSNRIFTISQWWLPFTWQPLLLTISLRFLVGSWYSKSMAHLTVRPWIGNSAIYNEWRSHIPITWILLSWYDSCEIVMNINYFTISLFLKLKGLHGFIGYSI